MSKRKNKRSISKILLVAIVLLILVSVGYFKIPALEDIESSNLSNVTIDLDNVPAYEGTPYVYINNNIPHFTQADLNMKEIEYYSDLDPLGRCGVVYANICKNIMPEEEDERESISHVTPSGWVQKSYKGLIEGNYLYNRCHLIGYQLAGENANAKNLITGTRYMNVDGMLPFENMVAEYVKENPGNHVIYRITPIFEGDNLVASGVQMEAYSVEDDGKGISFNVYVYNVQPGIVINYLTGESQKAD